MSIFKVDFEAMEWEEGREGVRHIGLVLAGGLKIDFNGTVVSFSAGDGLFIPPGAATAHRGLTIAPRTRLLMVEDAET